MSSHPYVTQQNTPLADWQIPMSLLFVRGQNLFSI